MSLDSVRWQKEKRLMREYFPQFTPYSRDAMIGFRGNLEGPRTGRLYDVVIEGSISAYPHVAPALYIWPRPEPHHVLSDGQLDVCKTWNPSRDTFASWLLVATAYIYQYDGEAGQPETWVASTGGQKS